MTETAGDRREHSAKQEIDTPKDTPLSQASNTELIKATLDTEGILPNIEQVLAAIESAGHTTKLIEDLSSKPSNTVYDVKGTFSQVFKVEIDSHAYSIKIAKENFVETFSGVDSLGNKLTQANQPTLVQANLLGLDRQMLELNVPCLSKLHGVIESPNGETLALVTELVDGPSVDALLKSGISRTEVEKMINKFLDSLDEQGLVFWDPTLTNIRLAERGFVLVDNAAVSPRSDLLDIPREEVFKALYKQLDLAERVAKELGKRVA